MSYSYHRMWRISIWAIGLIILTVLFSSPCTAATGADLDVSILQY